MGTRTITLSATNTPETLDTETPAFGIAAFGRVPASPSSPKKTLKVSPDDYTWNVQ